MAVKETKIEKMYYTMGEIAEGIGESVSLVRFWTKSLPMLFNPKRNKKGNRLFSPDEYHLFLRLHHLVKDKGMKLESAAGVLRSGDDYSKKEEVVQRLSSIRRVLADILDDLE